MVVSTSIFTTFNSSDNQQILIFTAIISLFAAILASLQTFLDYSALAAKHYAAAIKYGRLRRLTEEILVSKKEFNLICDNMSKVREEWNKVEEESPIIPQRFHDMAYETVKPNHEIKIKE